VACSPHLGQAGTAQPQAAQTTSRPISLAAFTTGSLAAALPAFWRARATLLRAACALPIATRATRLATAALRNALRALAAGAGSLALMAIFLRTGLLAAFLAGLLFRVLCGIKTTSSVHDVMSN
jgi:hypothetical protein